MTWFLNSMSLIQITNSICARKCKVILQTLHSLRSSLPLRTSRPHAWTSHFGLNLPQWFILLNWGLMAMSIQTDSTYRWTVRTVRTDVQYVQMDSTYRRTVRWKYALCLAQLIQIHLLLCLTQRISDILNGRLQVVLSRLQLTGSLLQKTSEEKGASEAVGDKMVNKAVSLMDNMAVLVDR